MKGFLRENLVTLLTVTGVVGGAVLGITLNVLSKERWTPRQVIYFQFPGDLFLRMLKALIVPLLMTSVISAVGSLDLSLSKKIAYRSIFYYATTTICAVILGILLVITIRPGVGLSQQKNETREVDSAIKNTLTQDTLLDLLR